jgi:hypothetical protein
MRQTQCDRRVERGPINAGLAAGDNPPQMFTNEKSPFARDF